MAFRVGYFDEAVHFADMSGNVGTNVHVVYTSRFCFACGFDCFWKFWVLGCF